MRIGELPARAWLWAKALTVPWTGHHRTARDTQRTRASDDGGCDFPFCKIMFRFIRKCLWLTCFELLLSFVEMFAMLDKLVGGGVGGQTDRYGYGVTSTQSSSIINNNGVLFTISQQELNAINLDNGCQCHLHNNGTLFGLIKSTHAWVLISTSAAARVILYLHIYIIK